MSIEDKALAILSKKKKLTTKDIVNNCGVSRQYANLVIRKLIKEGCLIKIGSTFSAFYVSPSEAENLDIVIRKKLKNESLEEHKVLEGMRSQLFKIPNFSENVRSIFEYAFSEILNNAIEHSKSASIVIEVGKKNDFISFVVEDFGIGVFKNIMKKSKLNSELEAIQDLLKGKATTQPKVHSGEGIFFTSKAADMFILESFGYRLRIDNIIKDVFIEEIKPTRGTKVVFFISSNSKKHLNDIFKEYQANSLEVGFDKTEIKVKLFTMGIIYISRSQARRILTGLDKFKSIIFDFNKVPTVGQAFVDEIFRVFLIDHPEIKIQTTNTNKAVQFMINRVDKSSLAQKNF